jgi:hypothetical protein
LDLDADDLDQNAPAHPCWYPDVYGINPDAFFDRLAGLVTYGSPLETFAEFWPNLVMTRRKAVMTADFQWFNLYDPIDLVAAPIKSLPPIGGVSASNLAVSTHPFFFMAHTSYLSRKENRQGHDIGRALVRWFLHPKDSLTNNLRTRGVVAPSRLKTIVLKSLLVTESALILGVGALVLPAILAGIARLFVKFPVKLYHDVATALLDSLHDLDHSCGPSHGCRVLHLLSKLAPDNTLGGDITISVAVLLSVFLLLLLVALLRRLIKGLIR